MVRRNATQESHRLSFELFALFPTEDFQVNVTDISRESVQLLVENLIGVAQPSTTRERTIQALLALLSAKEQAEGAVKETQDELSRTYTRVYAAEDECKKRREEWQDWLNRNEKLTAERDALKALCGELVAKHEKVVAWLMRYAEMHEKAAKDTRFQSLAVADVKAAANYRATAADIQPLLTRARSLL